MPSHSTITFDQLKVHFHEPLAEVADKFGLCVTLLKKICRDLDIPRWPHRKLLSLENLMKKHEEILRLNPHDKDSLFHLEELKLTREKILSNPSILGPKTNANTDLRIKKIISQINKEKKKKFRQEKLFLSSLQPQSKRSVGRPKKHQTSPISMQNQITSKKPLNSLSKKNLYKTSSSSSLDGLSSFPSSPFCYLSSSASSSSIGDSLPSSPLSSTSSSTVSLPYPGNETPSFKSTMSALETLSIVSEILYEPPKKIITRSQTQEIQNPASKLVLPSMNFLQKVSSKDTILPEWFHQERERLFKGMEEAM